MAVLGRQNQLEYFLQGSVGKDSVNTLLHRLRGLCDGASRQVATFVDHEMVFILGKDILLVTALGLEDFSLKPEEIRGFSQ